MSHSNLAMNDSRLLPAPLKPMRVARQSLLSGEASALLEPVRRMVGARLFAVGSGVLVALAVWAVGTLLLGGEVRTPAFGGIPDPMPIGATDVILVSGILALVAWASLAVLERLTARGRNVWAMLAVVALVLSLGTPLAGTGISVANRLVLLLIHLCVGMVLIPMLYKSGGD